VAQPLAVAQGAQASITLTVQMLAQSGAAGTAAGQLLAKLVVRVKRSGPLDMCVLQRLMLHRDKTP
jgi:hypothetical protein